MKQNLINITKHMTPAAFGYAIALACIYMLFFVMQSATLPISAEETAKSDKRIGAYEDYESFKCRSLAEDLESRMIDFKVVEFKPFLSKKVHGLDNVSMLSKVDAVLSRNLENPMLMISSIKASSTSFVNPRNSELVSEASNVQHLNKDDSNEYSLSVEVHMIGTNFGTFELSRGLIGMNIKGEYKLLDKNKGIERKFMSTIPVSGFDKGLYVLDVSEYNNKAYALLMCAK